MIKCNQRTKVFQIFQLIPASEGFTEKFSVFELGDAANAEVVSGVNGFTTEIDHFLVNVRTAARRKSFVCRQIVQATNDCLQVTWPHVFAGIKSKADNY